MMRNRASENLALQSLDSGFSPADCPGMTATPPSFLCGLGAQALFLLAQFRRQRLAEILGRKYLPDLDLVAAVERRALHPVDGLIERFGVDQPEAGGEIVVEVERA